MNNVTQFPKWLFSMPKLLKKWAILMLVLLVLPWRQFGSGIGNVTALDPIDRFQEIHAPITGLVQRWHVGEGDFVKAGQLLVTLSDTDPNLLSRLENELEVSVKSHQAAENALKTGRLNQTRQQQLFNQGLGPRKTWEEEQIKVNQLEIKLADARSKLLKVQNTLARQTAQEVRAPRAGQVLRPRAGDGGQLVKQGDALLMLAPSRVNLGAQLWLDGNDVAMVQVGSPVRLEFAGWPAVQVSGWPSLAVGTFRGKVVAVDTIASQKGLFRGLISPDERWPVAPYFRQPAPPAGFVMFNQVTVAQELWRRFNGLPLKGAFSDEKELTIERESPQ